MNRLIGALCLAAGFAGTLAAMSWLLPFDYDPSLHVKFEHFKATKDDYTVLAIGASRVFREIVPDRLDSTFRARGIESRTFNMALAGMESLEAHFILEHVAALHPKNLRVVLVGTDLLPGNYESWEIDPVNTRNVYWRTPAETARDVLNHARGASGPRDMLRILYHSLVLGAYRWTMRGRLSDAILLALDPPSPSIYERNFAQWRGYFPLELDPFETFVEMHKAFVENPGTFASYLSGAADDFHPPAPPYPPQFHAARSILNLARQNGWKVVFLRPSLEILDRSYPTGCEDPSPDCVAIGFEDRRKYPALYRYSSYYDYLHLNRKAAADFSGQVAERILDEEGFLANR